MTLALTFFFNPPQGFIPSRLHLPLFIEYQHQLFTRTMNNEIFNLLASIGILLVSVEGYKVKFLKWRNFLCWFGKQTHKQTNKNLGWLGTVKYVKKDHSEMY